MHKRIKQGTAILRWLLAAFFLIGGAGNIFATETILADYARWGYPGWFHYVTGALELVTSLLFVVRPLAGAVLGSTAMGAALVTVLAHAEYAHALPASAVLVAIAAYAAGSDRRRALF